VIYLASPNTQQQAEHVSDMPVLLSFACYSPWLDRYQASFSRLLIDSGAYSEMNSGKTINASEYAAWCERWLGHADAIAGLDDIRGDWKKSLANYEAFDGGFPTIHDTDPPELLDDLIAICVQRKQWLGVGLMPPRHGKESWIRDTLDRVPDSIHIHGWALRAYSHIRRLDSIDSTNWWRDGMDIAAKLPWLTYGECLEIVVKRYKRETRKIVGRSDDVTLFT